MSTFEVMDRRLINEHTAFSCEPGRAKRLLSARDAGGLSRKVLQTQKRASSLHLLKRNSILVTASLQGVASSIVSARPGVLSGIAANTVVYVLGYQVLLKGLTPAGVLHSWVLGSSVFSAFGWQGYLLVCLYFLLGSAATRVKLSQKQAEGIAEKRSGRRSIGSVWGSGLSGLICALAALSTQHHQLWQTGFVASFVSKFSDTISSEIGKILQAYGQSTYLSTTLRPVPRGTEGAVSVEGTMAGLAAAVGFTFIGVILQLVAADQAWIVVLAAFAANWAESLLGALLQGKQNFQWLSNDIVNILQTCLAAYVAMFFIDF